MIDFEDQSHIDSNVWIQKVSRLVDGDANPIIPYSYEAMDRAKEKIVEKF